MFKGQLWLLERHNGSEFVAIGGLRSNGLTVSAESVDTTTCEEAPARHLSNFGGATLSFSGAGVVTDDASLVAMEADAVSAEPARYRMISQRGDHYDGYFIVISCERSGAWNDAEHFSVQLESSASPAYSGDEPALVYLDGLYGVIARRSLVTLRTVLDGELLPGAADLPDIGTAGISAPYPHSMGRSIIGIIQSREVE